MAERRKKKRRKATKPPPLTRSQIMARIRGRDTKPEMLVRRALHAAGLRFRIHGKGLPGRPDVVNRTRRWAVLVHGCFWHHHEGCQRAGVPKSGREGWLAKFAANRARDRRDEAALAAMGYDVQIVWECEIAAPGRLEALAASLGKGEDGRERCAGGQ